MSVHVRVYALTIANQTQISSRNFFIEILEFLLKP